MGSNHVIPPNFGVKSREDLNFDEI